MKTRRFATTSPENPKPPDQTHLPTSSSLLATQWLADARVPKAHLEAATGLVFLKLVED